MLEGEVATVIRFLEVHVWLETRTGGLENAVADFALHHLRGVGRDGEERDFRAGAEVRLAVG